jgi:uncharacterized membrane protein YtjA (UPF0391 family)
VQSVGFVPDFPHSSREIWSAAQREPWFPPQLVGAASGEGRAQEEEWTMLGWVVTFLIVALVAGLLGFGGIAGASIEIAKVIFFIAVVLFLVSAVVGLARGRRL